VGRLEKGTNYSVRIFCPEDNVTVATGTFNNNTYAIECLGDVVHQHPGGSIIEVHAKVHDSASLGWLKSVVFYYD